MWFKEHLLSMPVLSRFLTLNAFSSKPYISSRFPGLNKVNWTNFQNFISFNFYSLQYNQKKYEKNDCLKRSRHIGNFKNFKMTLRQELDDLTKNNGIFCPELELLNYNNNFFFHRVSTKKIKIFFDTVILSFFRWLQVPKPSTPPTYLNLEMSTLT